jgi:CRP-like cAMP-binding protein
MYARRNINERLALAILILSEKLYSGEFANRKIHFTITRTDLANFVGTSLENIVRSLKTFADSGMVRTDGKTIYVQDYERIFASSGISRSHLH